MDKHPINLALRFLLELLGLFALAHWGWAVHSGLIRWVWMILLPLGAAAAWGVFRVPNDPGKAVVAVPGWVRLGLEVVYFGSATWAYIASGWVTAGWVFGGVTLLHYAVSYPRIAWLLRRS